MESSSVPEVLTNGLSEPWSAAPIAWTAPRSNCAARTKPSLATEGQVVPVGQVDDAVGGRRRRGETVEIIEVAILDLGTEFLQGEGGLVRAGQPDDFVAGPDQLGDEGRTDVAGRAGDEDTHEIPPGVWALGSVKGEGK